MIPATSGSESFGTRAGKSSRSPGSKAIPAATSPGIFRPASSMSSTSIRPSNALTASRQMLRAAAVVLPLRGLQQMPRILMARGDAAYSASLAAAEIVAPLPRTAAVAALPRNPRRVRSDGMAISFHVGMTGLPILLIRGHGQGVAALVFGMALMPANVGEADLMLGEQFVHLPPEFLVLDRLELVALAPPPAV